MYKNVFILLGSNIGNREENINQAISHIENIHKTKIVSKAPVIETKPMDYIEQPMFFNTVIKLETELLPSKLLKNLQQIEIKMGRIKEIPKGPRIIDCDILLFDNLIINTEELQIPHQQIYNRWFASYLISLIDKNIIDPVTKINITEVCKCNV